MPVGRAEPRGDRADASAADVLRLPQRGGARGSAQVIRIKHGARHHARRLADFPFELAIAARDLALSKNFYAGTSRLQFRADFINAFNHTQWLAVDNACSAANTVTLNRCDIGGSDTFGNDVGTATAGSTKNGQANMFANPVAASTAPAATAAPWP